MPELDVAVRDEPGRNGREWRPDDGVGLGLECASKFHAAEIEDLERTFDWLQPHGETGIIKAAGA